ncbi:PQQ-binding-like beta-propeller repeat protein [Acanthopleuribacter pedis]|uniref:PQQ-like beta-propeller repeat protein n=1 Tax=Acanthopleuribacter pedis TaxID=442870 RepID=A0A8J7QB18_9BACT|nr:PQQ-binding-like beta-propeller repeat protein [Acanthopleuribacter pedis]MBO1322216.1 PQQ-like beta-propeller repeat protein [Acanthopleuribacter pedis]
MDRVYRFRVFWISCLLIVGGMPALAAGKADWPQWRGPARDGISPAKKLITSWPEGGPKLLWRNSGLGSGYSSLAVVGDAVYTMGDVGEEQFVIAASSKDGKVLWRTKVGTAWVDQYGGARSTPTYDDGHIFAISTAGRLVCLSAKDGKEVWGVDLAKKYGARMAAGNNYEWKFSESPLIDGDRVVVTPGMADAALVVLNKKTGAEIWKSSYTYNGEKGDDGAGYSSVVISNGAGVKQYVQLMGRGIMGFDAKDGRFLWSYDRISNKIANIPTPVISGDYVFTSTGYGTGSALLKLKKKGNGVMAEEVYFLTGKELQNHHGGVILYKDHLYLGTAHNKGFPVCVDLKTGEKKWGPERNDGIGSAAISMADGHLYFRYQNGLMVLIEATPEGYKEKGKFMIPDVGNFSWSHPVIAHNKLYLREQGNLFCYELAN